MENYQKITDSVIENNIKEGKRPKLLLHSCCAPCSSYVFEYLNKYFEITAYFYNPNISSSDEFYKRSEELKRFSKEFPMENGVAVVIENYDHYEFLNLVYGKEDLKEGGLRCYDCYKLRLEKSAIYAKENDFEMFTTTLSISPHKNAQWLNEIGKELSDKYDICYLFSDFKKKNGYKRSCELSAEYNLYRQSFCGCEFSKRDALLREKE